VQILIIILFLAVFTAKAQESTDQIINLQQQKLQEDERIREIEKAKKDVIKYEEVKIGIDKQGDEICFDIKKIIVENEKLNVKKILKRYQNKCLGVNKINNLIKELTNLCISKGFVTSRVLVKQPQNLKDGTLELVTIEGKIDEIHRNDDVSYKVFGFDFGEKLSKNRDLSLHTSHPFLIGKPLNLRSLEQDLEQINRLSINEARMKIMPSSKQGFSDIAITNKRVRNLTPIGITYNNNSMDVIGRNAVSASVNLEDTLKLNESFYVSISKSFTEKTNINFDRNIRKYNDSSYIYASLPLGHYNFDYSFADSKFSTPITLSNGDILYSFGETKTHNLKAKRLLARGQKHKTNIEVTLVSKDISNFTEVRDLTTKSEISSRNLTVGKLTLNNTFYVNNGIFIINPSINQGLDYFGALSDSASSQLQRAQYTSYSLYSYFTKNIWKVNYSLTLNGQYSEDQLFGSEQIFIGGAYSVRGFRNVSIGGDKGFSARNEIKFKLNNIHQILKKLSITQFYDYGYVKSNALNSEMYNLSGTGLKLAFVSKIFNVDLTYARALNVPQTLKNQWLNQDGRDVVYLNVGMNF